MSIVTAFVLLFVACNLAFVSTFSPEDAQKIDDFINGVIQCDNIPGAAFALVQDQQTLMTRGYGVANVETQAPVTVNTKFEVASITKSMAAALLTQIFHEQDSYAWDTPVKQMVPSWFHFADGYRSNETTMTDAFAHVHGIPRHDPLFGLGGVTTREELMRKVRFLKPVYEFRTRLNYNNIYYGVGAFVAEQLAGASWEDLTIQRLFTPLGMTDSTFIDRAAPSWEGFATPYLIDENDNLLKVEYETLKTLGIPGAAGSVCSTAADFARYLKFHISGGRNENGDQVVNDTALQTTHTAQAVPWGHDTSFNRPDYHVSDTLDQYGFGWFTGYYRGYPKIAHGGDHFGFHSLQTIINAPKLGIFVTFNSPGRSLVMRDLIHQYSADVAMGVTPWLSVEKACNITRPQYAHPRWDDVPLQDRAMKGIYVTPDVSSSHMRIRATADYVGVYGNFGYGNITVTLSDTADQLKLSYGTIGRFDLYPTEQADEFIMVGVGPASVFVYNAQFSKSSGSSIYDRLSIPLFESLDPPVFIRGLKMADAPAPPMDNCSPRFP